MLAFFTDFGFQGPYLGQMRAVVHRIAPQIPVVDLLANAPAGNSKASAYLLASYAPSMGEGAVLCCVVDPGVGSDRAAIMLKADKQWFVGPDNGLFELVIRRARMPLDAYKITWRPEQLSHSFHGRDLFAPVAARLANNDPPPAEAIGIDGLIRPDWPDDLAAVVYVDDFGNCITGMRAGTVSRSETLIVAGRELSFARTFSEAKVGEAFWYENANGLIEVAVNLGRANEELRLRVGSPVDIKGRESVVA